MGELKDAARQPSFRWLRPRASPDVLVAGKRGNVTTASVVKIAVPASILLLAFAIRAFWVSRIAIAPQSDFATFYDMAVRIAHGHWDSQSFGWSYQGAGYPLLLAPFILIFNNLGGVREANILFQCGTVAVIWLIGRRLFGFVPACAGAFLAAILPGIWTYTAVVAGDNAGMFLLTLTCYLLCLRPFRKWAWLLGVVSSALALTRPSHIPFLIIVALAVAVAGRTVRWRQVRWFIVGAACVLAPVFAINHSQGSPPLSTGASAFEIWIVHNEHATGSWFPSQSQDDYPFAGISDKGTIRAAQFKLGLQFIVANPRAALASIGLRHRLNWDSDALGVFWTLDQATPAQRDSVPFSDHLSQAANDLYLLALLLAGLGALQAGRRTDILAPLIVPIGYVVFLLAVVAEGNLRYHAVVLPLMCVMAGAAFTKNWLVIARQTQTFAVVRTRQFSAETHRVVNVVRERRRSFDRRREWMAELFLFMMVAMLLGIWWWGLGRPIIERLPWSKLALWRWNAVRSLAGTVPWSDVEVWRWSRGTLATWLAPAIVGIPLIRILVHLSPRWAASFARHAQARPVRTWAMIGLAAIVALTVALSVVTVSDRLLAQLAAVDPRGWQRYEILPGQPSRSVALTLQPSASAGHARAVSYPDAAEMQFDAAPKPGETVALGRSLYGLEVGKIYHFYVQVYDPGTKGSATDTFSITLNGVQVWARGASDATAPGWRDIDVAWTADQKTVWIQIEHSAGPNPDSSAGVPAVRNLHLYPAY